MQPVDTPSEPASSPQVQAIMPELRRRASRAGENFSVLSPLLPKDLIDDFAAVYAFCRRADDLADSGEPTPTGRAAALENLASLRSALDRWLSGAADADSQPVEKWHPEDAMLARLAQVVRARSLRAEHFHHLLDAFERDQRQLRYETWDDLLSYCRDSADPVGRLVLELGGIDTADEVHASLLRRSDAICTALQLTNHWQGVRGDLLERDRVYLPREETGLGEEDLRAMIERPGDPELRVRYIKALRPLVERTRKLYEGGRPIVEELAATPARRLAPTVWLLSAGGEATLHKIHRRGCTTLWKRPRLGISQKMVLVLRAAAVRARIR